MRAAKACPVEPLAIHEPGCNRAHRDPWEPPKPFSACGGTFRCPTCKRFVGWCRGCHDDQPDVCDDCYLIPQETS
jgi:hypothetical protein